VGTNLITSKDFPAFTGVYKLAAVSTDNGPWIPKIKLSENPVKVTTPGIKKIVRLYDKATGKIKADLITLADELVNEQEDITIFDPLATWKRMTLKAGTFTTRDLLAPVFVNGESVHKERPVMEIRDYALGERDSLWDEHKRLVNPHPLPVDLSQKLYDLKQTLIAENKR
jgi:nicotinate phosphoribosyltransferase